MGTKTQNLRILAALLAGESLTALDALERFGCFRLTSRIHDLKKQGAQIDSEFVEVMNREGNPVRVKRYWLEGAAP